MSVKSSQGERVIRRFYNGSDTKFMGMDVIPGQNWAPGISVPLGMYPLITWRNFPHSDGRKGSKFVITANVLRGADAKVLINVP